MILSVALALFLLTAVAGSAALARSPLPPSSPISERADRLWRGSILIAAITVAVLGNMPLIGLPGFGWLELAEPIARSAWKSIPYGRFESNASWPSAMVITALWPASFIPAYRLARLGRSAGELALTTTAALALVVSSGLGLALAMIGLYFAW